LKNEHLNFKALLVSDAFLLKLEIKRMGQYLLAAGNQAVSLCTELFRVLTLDTRILGNQLFLQKGHRT
jgi:hypothetical protein